MLLVGPRLTDGSCLIDLPVPFVIKQLLSLVTLSCISLDSNCAFHAHSPPRKPLLTQTSEQTVKALSARPGCLTSC